MKHRRNLFFLASPLIMTLVLSAAESDMVTNTYRAKAGQSVVVSSTDTAVNDIFGHELSDVNVVAEKSNGHHSEVKLFGKSISALAQFGVTVLNFTIFFGILFMALRRALSSAFRSQKEELKNRLFKSEKDKEEARRQVQELETRMTGLQQELSNVMAKAEMDAKSEQIQILEAARVEVAQIMSQTYADIETLKQGAKAELHAMVMELVISNATQRLTAQLRGDLASTTLDRAIEKVRVQSEQSSNSSALC
jgi:F0F1-type ATP synthase membrane subunit b/b'